MVLTPISVRSIKYICLSSLLIIKFSKVYPNTDTGFSGIIKTVEGNEARVSKGQTNMATIFTVSDNRTSDTLAFSSADAMLSYVRDLSEDLAPEGATLMLGGVPASNKVVKAHFARSSRGTAAAPRCKLDRYWLLSSTQKEPTSEPQKDKVAW